MNKGFTILEVVLAIFILTCGVAGSFALIQQTLSSIVVSQAKLTASYLAQEGIEIAKNIRDSNWLEQRINSNISWDDSLTEGNWQVDFKNQTLPYDSQGHFLNIDSSGFYSYSVGSATPFKRKISFSEKTDLDGDDYPDKMKISVQVSWEERGRTHAVEAVDYLYNWYGSKEEKPSSQVCHSGGVPQTCDGEDATALDCTAGQEACRRCVSGICTYYTSGQHGCSPDYECSISGYCVSTDVCTGIPDNTQVPGCNGTCQACQSGTCGFADSGTDPGSDCTGVYSCSGFTTRLRNMCNGSGTCADIDGAASDCSGTCASYCSSGSCISTDTEVGTCTVSTDARVVSDGDGRCVSADCVADCAAGVELLRPNGAGDLTDLLMSGSGGGNWDRVDEIVADDDTTYVYCTAETDKSDLYNLPNHVTGCGTINSIKVYFRARIIQPGGQVYPLIKEGETLTTGIPKSFDTSQWTTYNQSWTTNPRTSVAWTWDDIDNLQIGIRLVDILGNNSSVPCTQVYVEVDYAP